MGHGYGLPEELRAAIAARAGAAAEAARLSARYRGGGTSDGGVELAAYLVTRLPATYAACRKVFEEVNRRLPGFSPASMLDAGAGPGTASWAAAAVWPGLEHYTMIEPNSRFRAAAERLARSASHVGLRAARIEAGTIGADLPKAELVAAAYVLAELPDAEAAQAALRLWAAAQSVLVLIEPGTPRGFVRIGAARAALVAAGAYPAAPCPHARPCPIDEPDWCHFSVRLPRSRAHLHAKRASVPYEDEKFAWLAVRREKVMAEGARILSPPVRGKAAIRFKLCTARGISAVDVARRNPEAYRRARKLDWGDLWEDKE